MYPISRYSLIFCSLVLIVTAFKFYPRWEYTGSESTLSWDASGYYMYLPAIFIYQDIKKCNFKDSIIHKYQPTPDFQQAYLHEESGNYVMKYASGLALVSLPFFAIGHIWASASDVYPADGFSYPYQASIGIGLFLLSLIGIFYLRKLLLLYYQDKTVAIVLMAYVIGTNFINYAVVDQAMTHSTLFTIYTLLLWHSIRFHQKLQWKNAVFIGMLTGLATLIRPTEMISILLPLFWGVASWATLKERLAIVLNHYHMFLVAAFLFCSLLFIQPLYWKYATGDWLVYSYGDQGFNWLRPHVYNYILSYCCGWLRYTPMMLIPLIGLWVFYKNKINTVPVIGFILISFYIVTAWEIWDYGRTSGRAMIQYYPILAFPFAALIEAADQKKWYQYILYPVLVFFVYLNIWWVYHAHAGQVQSVGLSKEYYWAKIGRWTAVEEDKKLLDNKYVFRNIPPNPNVIYKNDFENDTSTQIVERDGNKQIRLNLENQFSPIFTIDQQKQFKKWIRVKATFSFANKEWDLWRQTQFIVKFYNGEQEVQANMIRIYRFIEDGESKEIYLDAKTPKSFSKISVFFWHAGSDKELWIDDLKVFTFDD